jgi:hypothetical protein
MPRTRVANGWKYTEVRNRDNATSRERDDAIRREREMALIRYRENILSAMRVP